MDNPYLDEVPEDDLREDPIPESTEGWPPEVPNGPGGLLTPPSKPPDVERRQEYVDDWAWAIPNEEAIRTCVEYSPLLEIGAGHGYWASLIQANGGEILPMDKHTNSSAEFTSVHYGTPNTARKHPNRTLMLCWPPLRDSMGVEALDQYAAGGGETLIYIGEPKGGCCANLEFFDRLESDWVLQESVTIPRWDISLDARDELKVFKLDIRGRAHRLYEEKKEARAKRWATQPKDPPATVPDQCLVPTLVWNDVHFSKITSVEMSEHGHSRSQDISVLLAPNEISELHKDLAKVQEAYYNDEVLDVTVTSERVSTTEEMCITAIERFNMTGEAFEITFNVNPSNAKSTPHDRIQKVLEDSDEDGLFKIRENRDPYPSSQDIPGF